MPRSRAVLLCAALSFGAAHAFVACDGHSEPEKRETERAPRADETSALTRTPTSPDPSRGAFSLQDALAGLPTEGALVAELTTDAGTLLCELAPDRAPRAVASFVGLARGLRPWWDARSGAWVRRPYYRGLTFHRVRAHHFARGGDYLGDGSGAVGYTVPDERHAGQAHDRAGQLCLANPSGPGSAGAQIVLTDGPAPELDGASTIFGRCRPLEVIARITRRPARGETPRSPARIERVRILRVEEGGAAKAH